MAGMGKRMRPHTLSIPKPLIPIAGKPIVQRLVEEIAAVSHEPIEEIAYIIGDFGEAVEQQLKQIAENNGAKASIYYQEEALGTAHAIYCAEASLDGKVIVAFADTLFKADFKIDDHIDASIWVKKVEDPSAFGVVKLDDKGCISDFVEKPQEFVSDLAIIGIYYFKQGEQLKEELKYLLDNNVTVGGEYQLTDALENMKNKGVKFVPGEIIEWMDCGNKNATVNTNSRILDYHKSEGLVSKQATIKDSVIIPPCFIADNVVLENAVVGPYVSIDENSEVRHSVISNAIVQKNTKLENAVVKNSMLGNNVDFKKKASELNLGDFTQVEC